MKKKSKKVVPSKPQKKADVEKEIQEALVALLEKMAATMSRQADELVSLRAAVDKLSSHLPPPTPEQDTDIPNDKDEPAPFVAPTPPMSTT